MKEGEERTKNILIHSAANSRGFFSSGTSFIDSISCRHVISLGSSWKKSLNGIPPVSTSGILPYGNQGFYHTVMAFLTSEPLLGVSTPSIADRTEAATEEIATSSLEEILCTAICDLHTEIRRKVRKSFY